MMKKLGQIIMCLFTMALCQEKEHHFAMVQIHFGCSEAQLFHVLGIDQILVGIPFRINVGKKAASGQVELVTRATGQSVDLAVGEIVSQVKDRVA